MCLIFIAYQSHATYPLVVAANRDEFHARSTAAADFWPDAPDVLAGRDLQAGGTWFGVTRGGRLAAITNYRAPAPALENAPSRGALTTEFLTGNDSAADYLQVVSRVGGDYNGFSLIAGDPSGLLFYSNRSRNVRTLTHGIHGLSNHLLDTPWPKLTRGKRALETLLSNDEPQPESILALLADRSEAAETELPDTGVDRALERRLSPIFIVGGNYGTRSSTVLLVDNRANVTFWERTFSPGGAEQGTVRHNFRFNDSTR